MNGAYIIMPAVLDETGLYDKKNLTQPVEFPYAVYQNGTISHSETSYGKITLYFSINHTAFWD